MEEVYADDPQGGGGPRGGGPQGGGRPQSLTACEFQAMHTQACQSIYAIATRLLLRSIVPQMNTYINAYCLWIECMQVMYSPTLQELEQKRESINYLVQMPWRKLAVIIPAVCFWISVKCTESLDYIDFRSTDMGCMIAHVQLCQGNYRFFGYNIEDIHATENAVLHLLDFDVLKHQEWIDATEDELKAHFGDMYQKKEAQSEIVRFISRTFEEMFERKDMSGPGNAGFPELVFKKFQADFPELGDKALEKFKEIFYCEVRGMWSLDTRRNERVMQEGPGQTHV